MGSKKRAEGDTYRIEEHAKKVSHLAGELRRAVRREDEASVLKFADALVRQCETIRGICSAIHGAAGLFREDEQP